MSLEFEPLWFDSMGAKSTCTQVKTPDVNIVLDPGVAIMHPSFPATDMQKQQWLKAAEEKIKKSCKKADVVTISHYHYDHYSPKDISIYEDKKLFAKNPNYYINNQQRHRAEDFYDKLYKKYKIEDKDKIYDPTITEKFPDPINDLPIAKNKDFGDYNKRRKEVLAKGKKRYDKLVKNWILYNNLPEIHSKKIKINFPEGKKYTFKDTKISFTKPLFHGIEYATVGWVVGTIIQYKKTKLIHTSDVRGPMIEDYADMIIKEKPQILIMDGPTTYLFGYILNRINLERTINNTLHIIKKIQPEILIWDHHLTREEKFKKRTKKVWDYAKEHKINLKTASEYLGKEPVLKIDD